MIPDAALRRLGIRAIGMIRTRVQELNLDVDEYPMVKYSERPFARPLGGITERARRALGDKLKVFTTRKGRLWAIIEGGYRAFKAATYPNDDGHVNLTATGAMLRSLTVISVNSEKLTIRLGFTRPEEAEKAFYTMMKRRWFGLTKKEKAEIVRLAGQQLIILPG